MKSLVVLSAQVQQQREPWYGGRVSASREKQAVLNNRHKRETQMKNFNKGSQLTIYDDNLIFYFIF